MSGWASGYIQRLRDGEAVEFRPRGNSMVGLIESGDLCRVVPVDREIQKDDIVLCKVRGAQYLHKVLAIRAGQYQIGNNRGGINGWIGSNAIYGRCVRINQKDLT